MTRLSGTDISGSSPVQAAKRNARQRSTPLNPLKGTWRNARIICATLLFNVFILRFYCPQIAQIDADSGNTLFIVSSQQSTVDGQLFIVHCSLFTVHYPLDVGRCPTLSATRPLALVAPPALLIVNCSLSIFYISTSELPPGFQSGSTSMPASTSWYWPPSSSMVNVPRNTSPTRNGSLMVNTCCTVFCSSCSR